DDLLDPIEGVDDLVEEKPETGEVSVEEPEQAEPEELTPTEEVEKWKDVAARAQADLENYRRRIAREKSEALQYANRGLLEQLLPIIDNFDMGLKAARDGEGESSIIYQGMAMVFKQIEDFLSGQQVEVIPSEGVAFDPNVHDAIKQESSESVPEGEVIYTLRRGYRLRERILRAASVAVSSGPPQNESTDDSSEDDEG
ncbi:MAG: nucleotide exchange factor GrpE, partial [Verrucomicrobiota bacterium]